MPNTNAGPAVSSFVNEVPLRGTFDTNGKLIQILGSGQNIAFDPANVAITGGVLNGLPVVQVGPKDPLVRWRSKLATSPTTAVMMFIGDSTSDETTSSQYMYQALRGQHVAVGGALFGMVGDSAHIVSAGFNGIALSIWQADPAKLAAVASVNPDLIVASFLLNDVRLGATTLAQAKTLLTNLVNSLRASVPGADILLRMPNTMLTTNVGGLNLVQTAGGVINPAGLAQTYSTLIRSAYLSMIGQWANVDVIDMQAEVFGVVCRASHPIIADQLHPTPQGSTIGTTVLGGGYVEIANAIAKRVGYNGAAFKLDTNQYLANKDAYTIVASGNGYFDISNVLNLSGLPAAQFPLTTADVIFIPGFDGPISLASANIIRPFGGTNIRITGFGVDYTAALGKTIAIGSSHPAATTADRQSVSVTIASIAAGATAETLVSVTGARTSDLQDATNVLCTPPSAFNVAGLRLAGCYPSANDQVKVIVNNPTAGAVALSAANFAFWVVR